MFVKKLTFLNNFCAKLGTLKDYGAKSLTKRSMSDFYLCSIIMHLFRTQSVACAAA